MSDRTSRRLLNLTRKINTPSFIKPKRQKSLLRYNNIPIQFQKFTYFTPRNTNRLYNIGNNCGLTKLLLGRQFYKKKAESIQPLVKRTRK